MKHTLCMAAAVASSLACGDVDLCVDGVYGGTVVLEAEGYVFAEPPSLFSPGSREVIPYADMPFATCRVIGGLFVQREGAVVDSDHYPVLEELGFISVQTEDEGGPPRIEEIAGFDGVVRFGGMSSPSFYGGALVDVISGFNAVERIEGSLRTSARLTGFAALHDVDGDLAVGAIDHGPILERVGGSAEFRGSFTSVDLPNLREVGGDLVLDGTRATTLGFPALEHVGGTLSIDANSALEIWDGLAEGSNVSGDFLATFNNPITDEDFHRWLSSDVTAIDGEVRVCANYSEGERTCTLP